MNRLAAVLPLLLLLNPGAVAAAPPRSFSIEVSGQGPPVI
jgi:hypothetical protein